MWVYILSFFLPPNNISIRTFVWLILRFVLVYATPTIFQMFAADDNAVALPSRGYFFATASNLET